MKLRERMTAHLDDLASQFGAEIRYRPATEETIARLTTGTRPNVEFPSILTTRPLVEMPPVRTRRDYFSGLHEFGHLACGLTGIALHDEATAWAWAVDHGVIPPTIMVWRMIDGCLASYIIGGGYHLTDASLDDVLSPAQREAWDELHARIDQARWRGC